MYREDAQSQKQQGRSTLLIPFQKALKENSSQRDFPHQNQKNR